MWSSLSAIQIFTFLFQIFASFHAAFFATYQLPVIAGSETRQIQKCRLSGRKMLRDFSDEEKTMIKFKQFLSKKPQEELEKMAIFLQVAIHDFHPSHPLPKIIKTSFCALVGSLLTNLIHYFDDSLDINMIFSC